MKRRDVGSGLGWLFTGATIGTAASLMLAPYDGRKMRKKMRAQLTRGKDTAVKTGRDVLRQCGSACASSGRAFGKAGGWTWRRVRSIA